MCNKQHRNEEFMTLKQRFATMLFVLSLVCLYLGISEFFAIRPASDYEDKGVHTFIPYKALPTQVKNTATGRQRRLNPTKTVYFVYYKTIDETSYEWKDKVSYKSTAIAKVDAGEPVERRVLSIRSTKNYITIAANQTAASYTARQQWLYGGMVLLSILYLVIYIAIWIIFVYKRRHESL